MSLLIFLFLFIFVEENTTSIYNLLRVTPTKSETVRYVIYPDSIMHIANVRALGVAVQRTVFGQIGPYNNNFEYILPKKLERRIRALRIPMTKIFGWHGGKIKGIDTLTLLKKELDIAHEICERFGIPEEWTILEFERQFGRNVNLNPAIYDSLVSYSIKKGYRFRIWRIKNEIYKKWTPEEYSKHLSRIVPTIRRSQPNSLIAIAIPGKKLNWTQKIIKLSQSKYDILMPHLYANLPTWKYKFEDITASQNFKVLSRLIELKTLISKTQNEGNKEILIIDGEWGLNSPGKNGERPLFNYRNGNILGTIHRAYRLIYYIRENLVDGAIGWNLLNLTHRRGKPSQGFSLLFTDAPNKTSLLFWLYFLFRKHLGKYVVKIDGSTPFFVPGNIKIANARALPITTSLVTYTPDSSVLYFIIVNSSYKDTLIGTLRIVGNIRINDVHGTVLSDFRPHPIDSLPVISDSSKVIRTVQTNLNNNKGLSLRVLPHSVTFLEIGLKNTK